MCSAAFATTGHMDPSETVSCTDEPVYGIRDDECFVARVGVVCAATSMDRARTDAKPTLVDTILVGHGRGVRCLPLHAKRHFLFGMQQQSKLGAPKLCVRQIDPVEERVTPILLRRFPRFRPSLQSWQAGISRTKSAAFYSERDEDVSSFSMSVSCGSAPHLGKLHASETTSGIGQNRPLLDLSSSIPSAAKADEVLTSVSHGIVLARKRAWHLSYSAPTQTPQTAHQACQCTTQRSTEQ